MQINISNKQRLLKLNSKIIKNTCSFIIQNELNLYKIKNKIKKDCDEYELSIFFIDEKKMITLNDNTFSLNSPTDVISFSYIDKKSFNLKKIIIGEIFISTEQALKVHKIYKNTLNFELLLYIIHGILHVFDYDDIDIIDRKKMKIREKFYFDFFKSISLHCLKD